MVDKKKKKSDKPKAKGVKNHKSHGVANVNSAKRIQQRNLDKAQQKEVVPLRNVTENVLPPDLIVVMGPKGCGKSTLIRSLVKLYTGQNITEIKGPITVVAGDRKRLTFFECPLDLYSMTDLAKVADLVIMMIDASYGFEMETFEFFNLLQLHGMPKVIGVLTHLDVFRSVKTLQNSKKAIKHRFWTEIFKGAKLFDLLGVINKKYRKHEIKRLALAISRIKYRPLIWRNSHPYLLLDRIEDVTQQHPSHSQPGGKSIYVYGFVRGSHLKSNMKVHLIGAGDFDLDSNAVTVLDDPCPLKAQQDNVANMIKRRKEMLLYAPMSNTGRVIMNTNNFSDDNLYIELRHVNYTKKDQLYLADQAAVKSDDEGDNEGGVLSGPMGMLKGLQDVKQGQSMNRQLKQGSLSLFADDDHEEGGDEYDQDDDGEDDMDIDDDDEEEDEVDEDDQMDDDEDIDEEQEDENDQDDKQDEEQDIFSSQRHPHHRQDDNTADEDDTLAHARQVESNFTQHSSTSHVHLQKVDIMQEIYGNDWAYPTGNTATTTTNTAAANSKSVQKKKSSFVHDEQEEDEDEDFFNMKPSSNSTSNASSGRRHVDVVDSSRLSVPFALLKIDFSRHSTKIDFNSENSASLFSYHHIKSRFAAGQKKSKNSTSDLEDLEEAIQADADSNNSDDEGEDSEDEIERKNDQIDANLRDLHAKQKANFSLKQASTAKDETDDTTDNKAKLKTRKIGLAEDEEERNLIEQAQRKFQLQSERNYLEFGKEGDTLRTLYEGYRQGQYLRVLLHHVPEEFLTSFHAQKPFILGGLLPNETAMGFLTARIKRHRWHKRVLKSNDPLIFSIGWRRFQSIPVYTTSSDNTTATSLTSNDRERFLKYTPEHMHCTATFYGPFVAPNSGILAYQTVENSTSLFRIAMTGTILEQRATPLIKKKLKLVGTPVKVFKNTAFISGMFSSALEVAKFEQTKLKTVSGIRGSIKKAVMDREGLGKTGGKASAVNMAMKPGTFRASFEDKILMSDIVICRLWVNVPIKQFYNPVLSLLAPVATTSKSRQIEDLSPAEEDDRVLMRNTAQLRRDLQVPQQTKKDSVYKPIIRQEREFTKLKIPAKLQASLPYATKMKHVEKKAGGYLQRRAVILEPEERKSRSLLQALTLIKKDKDKKREATESVKARERQKAKQRESDKFADVKKDEKRKRYREEGKDAARKANKEAGMGSSGKKRRRTEE